MMFLGQAACSPDVGHEVETYYLGLSEALESEGHFVQENRPPDLGVPTSPRQQVVQFFSKHSFAFRMGSCESGQMSQAEYLRALTLDFFFFIN